MILKYRQKPLDLLQAESLLQRAQSHHPLYPQWTETLRRKSAGYHGELRVDSLWHEIEMPFPHYFIHDLYINKTPFSHQMDSILITDRFLLILEIKSISGLLNFDPYLRQFSRTNKDGSIDGMNNPDDQIRRHEKWMNHYLAEQQLSLPVIGAIIFTYASSIIQSKPDQRIVIHSSGLPYLTEHLIQTHKDPLITKEQTRRLAENLLSLHAVKELKRDYTAFSLLQGVLCDKCNGEAMDYIHGKWQCRKCFSKDRLAHFSALEQYGMLFSPTITNQEFRQFTGLSSIVTASKLLKMASMPSCGTFRDRIYYIPLKIERKESKSGILESE